METSAAIARLSALAQETRLHIFRYLAQTGPQPAGRVGEYFNLPAPTLSFHLKALQQAGLLDSRRESRQLIYQARCDAIVELMAYLTEHCCNVPAVQPIAAILPHPMQEGDL
ncbi:MAG: helix-turn-helix transcriptional regulator [Candidatus Competibacter sp.]|nr:helix-turn-helix transcriptional regulator [Candidatus Competibacter sp.]